MGCYRPLPSRRQLRENIEREFYSVTGFYEDLKYLYCDCLEEAWNQTQSMLHPRLNSPELADALSRRIFDKVRLLLLYLNRVGVYFCVRCVMLDIQYRLKLRADRDPTRDTVSVNWPWHGGRVVVNRLKAFIRFWAT